MARFASGWITAGHHIRDRIADDTLLVRVLRHVLPPYDGEARVLYRGENRDRWNARRVGLAWTPDIETARMFGHGLNAVTSGGVLLTAHFEPEAIISGPNAHSRYLGEAQFTVDVSTATSLVAIEFFPVFR
jgi:hypothetical protein